jgi:hypothetical protein
LLTEDRTRYARWAVLKSVPGQALPESMSLTLD